MYFTNLYYFPYWYAASKEENSGAISNRSSVKMARRLCGIAIRIKYSKICKTTARNIHRAIYLLSHKICFNHAYRALFKILIMYDMV